MPSLVLPESKPVAGNWQGERLIAKLLLVTAETMYEAS